MPDLCEMPNPGSSCKRKGRVRTVLAKAWVLLRILDTPKSPILSEWFSERNKFWGFRSLQCRTSSRCWQEIATIVCKSQDQAHQVQALVPKYMVNCGPSDEKTSGTLSSMMVGSNDVHTDSTCAQFCGRGCASVRGTFGQTNQALSPRQEAPSAASRQRSDHLQAQIICSMIALSKAPIVT